MNGRLETLQEQSLSRVAGNRRSIRNGRCGNHGSAWPRFRVCFSAFFSYLVFLSDSFVFPLPL